MDLLHAFVQYAPDDIYDTLSHLDIHNVASAHSTLHEAVDARILQRRIHETNRIKKLDAYPSHTDTIKARMQVDEARLAMLDEPELLSDLDSARSDFRDVVKTFTTMFSRRKPTVDVFAELEDTFSRAGVWYTIFPPIYCSLIQMDIVVMGVCVTYTFTPGKHPQVDIRKTIFDREIDMHETWRGSLALAARILEIIDIPHTIKHIDSFPESADLRRCLLHNRLPEYDGSNDAKLNADFYSST
jgi:hypothetical protein